MKAVTFLGMGPYVETAYVHRGQEYVTDLFPLALFEFCVPAPEELLVFVTPEALETRYYQQLVDRLANRTAVRPVSIPRGETEGELWEIFNALTGSVSAGDQVTFDITHGLRSLPFVVFLAAAYLKTAQDIAINAILYGAFDVRDRSVEPHRTPVFDLSPFLSLLDWMTAADQFVETGDARRLAELLSEAELSKGASLAPGKIIDVASALFITSPLWAARDSRLMSIQLRKAEMDLRSQIPPFGLVAKRIYDTYGALGAEKLLQSPKTRRGDLRIQLKMIGWYMDNQHIPQALTLAREWLVTLTAYAIGRDVVLGRKEREPVEKALNAHARRVDGVRPEQIWEAELETKVAALECAATLANLWRRVTDLRNMIDHAFHESTPPRPSGFVEDATALRTDLEEIADAILGDAS